MKYCESVYTTKRRKTREVMIGHVGVGKDNPVRIQSMTTSSTRDVSATVDQIMRLADVGCEIARVTVQGMKEAEACEQIKNELLKKGYNIPLVADIHFYPPAAMKVVDFVEKVRVNPGNFVDKRASFKIIEYDDHSYAQEIEKIEEKFTPLVEKCKALKRSMRIGTNHGSLSDRIMNRYGDTPKGMVESALEFARICRQNDYHDFVFSMKSSNPQVMILAYRLLVAEMYKLDWDYPLHLGVTEAGEGEDGRIKSAMGIGALLLDGIGDTIRVSLTEDAWKEIDPCQRLVNWAQHYEKQSGLSPFVEHHRKIDEIKRRPCILPKEVGLHRDGSVLIRATNNDLENQDFYHQIGCETQFGRPVLKKASVDSLIFDETPQTPTVDELINRLKNTGIGVRSNVFTIRDETPEQWAVRLEKEKPSLIFLNPANNRLHYSRQFFDWLISNEIQIPVILNFSYTCSKEDLVIQASSECGALLCDGLGDGLFLEGPYEIDFLRNLSFGILQAARMRTTKTEFISCPSCGRTLFDLQEVTKKIRDRTSHLPGVKIAIMGCIVNGPGEMADADFGYVGSKPGMIDLYLGKSCVERNIKFDEAVDRLVELIKKEGRWLEPADSKV